MPARKMQECKMVQPFWKKIFGSFLKTEHLTIIGPNKGIPEHMLREMKTYLHTKKPAHEYS